MRPATPPPSRDTQAFRGNKVIMTRYVDLSLKFRMLSLDPQFIIRYEKWKEEHGTTGKTEIDLFADYLNMLKE